MKRRSKKTVVLAIGMTHTNDDRRMGIFDPLTFKDSDGTFLEKNLPIIFKCETKKQFLTHVADLAEEAWEATQKREDETYFKDLIKGLAGLEDLEEINRKWHEEYEINKYLDYKGPKITKWSVKND